jgi:hypothetical protein
MKRPLIFLLIILSALLPVLLSPPCYANSAEPPSIVIVVAHAPKDLAITLEPEGVPARRTDKMIESYFTFYRTSLKSSPEYTFKVTTGGKTFEVRLDAPLDRYNNIFTLNLKDQTLVPGNSISREIGLTALRILLTLAIEGVVFFLFGYRSKRSWIVFLAVNLVTQVFLNIWLLGNTAPLDSYIILTLFFGEAFVFVAELAAFLILLKEHGRLRTVLYVMAANLLSLILGGYLIVALPV